MSEVPQSTPHSLDIELGLHDVQVISNTDAVAAFFARLGYSTDRRTQQTPANLGITADGTARPIKEIELIADQENLFQVYLLELTSVTVAHTRSLARVFRNRAGNYLLVLTSDYEHLDFVLLEKYLPAESDTGPTIAPKQVGIRPRVLTVERRKPTRLQLRVLRRFTWTESDPFAQCDKLLSAYAIADWSEEFFNNRALFSDYYLLERLREGPEWTEDPKPAYLRLRHLYGGAASRFAGKEESVLRQELLEPALQALGFEERPSKESRSSVAEPDYRLYSPGRTPGSPLQQTPRALCLVYPWGRSLDGKDYERDKETREENPGAVVVSLLENGEAPWVVVTNGKLWRLYAQHAHSRATNYYEIDLEEVLAQAGRHAADPAEAFRYFWLLFRRQAFEPVEVEREGKQVTLSLLDQLLLESEDYARELGERLKERVFEEVFPHLRKLAIVKEEGREVYVSFSDLDEKERERADRQGRAVRRGQVYLENDKRERKATGSYYTPDYIVQYIVEHAVGPVLQEKFAAMRPKLREAQQRRRAFFQKQEALRKQHLKPEPEGKAEFIGQELVDDLFDIKVLDPAMGSGHFLVEVVDYITDKALDFLNAFPWNPVVAYLTRMRETILREMDEQGITIDAKRLTDVNLLKRHVLKRCIYGVDLNPMAVELAKVSLWLDCFTLGAPLSFLDHHLRCGNSLIGVTVQEVQEAVEPVARITDRSKVAASATEWKTVESRSEQFTLFGSRFAGLLLATDLMRHVGELSDVTSAQVQESRSEYRKASNALAPFKRILDTYTSQWFSSGNGNVGARRRRAQSDPPALAFLKSREAEAFINARDDKALKRTLDALSLQDRRIAETALTAAADKRFFHWELEFPEVFYGPRPGSTQLIERLEGAGFDAVIGNPPYVRVQELRQSDPAMADFLGLRYRAAVKNFDIYLPFFEMGLVISKNQVSYIAPNKWFATDYGVGLRKLVTEQRALARVVDFRDFQLFPDATNYTCILTLSRKPKESFVYVDAALGQIGQEEVHPLKNLSSDGGAWTFATGPEATLLQRLLGGGYPYLKELRDRAFQGLRTSDNEVYILRANGPVRKGLLPVTSRATGQTHEVETALLKPLLSGQEIRAFSLTRSDQWILFPYDLTKPKPVLLSEKRLREEYPGAWQHLRDCEDRLRARERGKMDGPGWWAFGRNQNLDQFEQPKVMLPGYNDKPSAGLDIEGKFYHVSGYSLTLKDDAPIDLWVLASLLNSNLLYWILIKTGVALQRGFAEFRPQYLDKLPIALPDPTQKRALEDVAQRARREGYDSIKAELNAIVYRLYGLTEEEIAIVEGRE